MSNVTERLKIILDRHTSRKNALTYGAGPKCTCEDCAQIRKAILEIENNDKS